MGTTRQKSSCRNRLQNGPHSLLRMKVGTHSPLPSRIAHSGLHAETGASPTGALSLPSEHSARSRTSRGPGIRTAYFAAFGSWTGALPENAESLRDSDALMRVAVPRRRGPAGLRDLFTFVEVAACTPCAQGLSACARRGVVSLPSVRFACSRNAGRPLVKAANLPFSEAG